MTMLQRIRAAALAVMDRAWSLVGFPGASEGRGRPASTEPSKFDDHSVDA